MATTQSPLEGFANVASKIVPLIFGSGTQRQTQTTSVDPTALASQQGVAATAIANSTNDAAIQSMIDNILNQAAKTFAPTAAAANGSGIYNSTTLRLLRDNAQAEATAQASKAALDFKTGQQQIAAQANASILQATRATNTTTANGSSLSGTGSALLPIAGGLAAMAAFKNRKEIASLFGDPAAEDTVTGGASRDSAGAVVAPESANPFSLTGIDFGDMATGAGGKLSAGVDVLDPGDPKAIGDGGFGQAISVESTAGEQTKGGGFNPDGGALTVGGVNVGQAGTVAGIGAQIAGAVGAPAIAGILGPVGLAATVANQAFDPNSATRQAASSVGDFIMGLFSGSSPGSESSGKNSVICTELMRQGKLSKRKWYRGATAFKNYPEIGKRAYHLWAIPVVRRMRANPDSLFTSAFAVGFNWRADNILAVQGMPGVKWKLRGALVEIALFLTCCFAGVLLPFVSAQSPDILYSAVKE